MNTKKLIIFVIVVAVIIWGLSLVSGKKDTQPITNTDDQTTGIVSTTTNAKMTYENKNLGITFNFPVGWHLGKNTLGDSSGYGYLQLFNYDETQTSGGSVFADGTNKIEIVITNDNHIATSSDYVEQNRETTQVQVAGKTATRFDITLAGNQKYRTYMIPLKERFLSMTIYGDPNNFNILDEIIKSVSFNSN